VGGRADQAFQLVAPMGGNLGVGVERQALYAGTAGTGSGACRRLLPAARAGQRAVLA
jgi:hypothetical protein